MNQCVHQCCRCKSYNSYYVINGFKYEKTKSGYCRTKRETVGLHDSCEYFSYKSPNESKCEPLLAARLENILQEISLLLQMIGEDRGDDVRDV